jgi:hypothetical protein
MTHTAAPNPLAGRSLRAPVLWGVVWGVIQAAAPLGFEAPKTLLPEQRNCGS